MIIYLDGTFKKVSNKELTQHTPGIVKGWGVFETMRIDKGQIQDLDEHLKRLQRGLKRFKISRRITTAFVKENTKKLLQKNNFKNTRLRLSVYRNKNKIHVSLITQRVGAIKSSYKVCVAAQKRPLNTKTHLKCIRYEIFRNALLEAKSKGYDEAILLNHRGHIVEASTANVFWLKGKKIYTPSQSCGCLNGVAKRRVLKQLKDLGYSIQKGNFRWNQLKNAEAAFLTNSLIDYRPISSLEGRRFKIIKLPIAP